jgi:hypothetical protein
LIPFQVQVRERVANATRNPGTMANASGDRHENTRFVLERDGRKVILTFTREDRPMFFWTASDALYGTREPEGIE